MSRLRGALGWVGRRLGAGASTSRASGAYAGASYGTDETALWSASRASADADLLGGSRETIAARARDLVRNNGWIAGAAQRLGDEAIGARFALQARPDWRALGFDADTGAAWAREWSREVEAKFRAWALDPRRLCDCTRRHSLPALLGQLFRQRVVEGESLAVLEWLEGRGGYATAVNVIDPDHLSNPNGAANGPTLRGGVELDGVGAVVAYHIQAGHPGDYILAPIGQYVWSRQPRVMDWGRPRVLHHFEPQRAGQHRGVSELAAVLERARMVERFERAELQSALIAATFAAFIKSPFDSDMIEAALGGGGVGSYQEARKAFHDKRQISLDGARIPLLYPGDEVEQLSGAHPHSGFEAFVSAALGSIATALGTSREELTGDYSGTNYSALRGAFLKSWKALSARRDAFADHVATPIYLAWLEEAIARGDVEIPAGAPALWEAPYAWSRCSWLGPARGWVDPTKEAQAAEIRIRAGVSSLRDEAAEQGKDWEELLEQQAAEEALRAQLGLSPRDPLASGVESAGDGAA